MFSVRLPSLSTRHEGPPGLRGHASQAAGTMEATQDSEGERLFCPLLYPAHPSPTGPMTPHLPPHQASPSWPKRHIPSPAKDTSPRRHSPLIPTHQLKHTHRYTLTYASPTHTHLDTHSPTWTRRTSIHDTGICLEAQSQPCRNGHSGPPSRTHTGVHRPVPQIHMGQGAPATTHRPPGPTAAAGPRRCSPGRPRSGSPCCGSPSCAPVWASSTGCPGGHGG